MKYIKNLVRNIVIATVALLTTTTIIKAAGDLQPQGEGGDDTHRSLKDVEAKLMDFTDTPTAISSPFSIPEGEESATFPTLTEIYTLLEAENNDLVPDNIANGVEIFGIVGNLGLRDEWSSNAVTGIDLDYYDALSACEDLEEDGGGWSLPTSLELHNAFINGESFSPEDSHWSSTEITHESSTSVYTVSMSNGNVSLTANTSAENTVRCVR